MKTLNLNKGYASKEPFKVPEGYFDTLTARVMAQLPADNGKQPMPKAPKSTLYAKLKPYIYMAAMFAGLYFGVFVFKYQRKLAEQKALVANTQQSAPKAEEESLATDAMNDYIDDACDYMMVSTHDILAYVSNDEF